MTFGGKAELFSEVIQVAIAGDDEPVPLAKRLTVPATYQMLVDERGWSAERYQQWLADTSTSELLFPTPGVGLIPEPH